jgi:hypothetical protein
MAIRLRVVASSSTEKIPKSKFTRACDKRAAASWGSPPFLHLGIVSHGLMDGKIDFIVCEAGGAWYIESLSVPEEIAVQPNPVLVEWAKRERFADEPDVVFIGVYWRDEILDETGMTNEAIVASTYQKMQRKVANAGN